MTIPKPLVFLFLLLIWDIWNEYSLRLLSLLSPHLFLQQGKGQGPKFVNNSVLKAADPSFLLRADKMFFCRSWSLFFSFFFYHFYFLFLESSFIPSSPKVAFQWHKSQSGSVCETLFGIIISQNYRILTLERTLEFPTFLPSAESSHLTSLVSIRQPCGNTSRLHELWWCLKMVSKP